jgi:hypothetical protein
MTAKILVVRAAHPAKSLVCQETLGRCIFAMKALVALAGAESTALSLGRRVVFAGATCGSWREGGEW